MDSEIFTMNLPKLNLKGAEDVVGSFIAINHTYMGQKHQNNKYPEATIRWIDYFYGDEGIRLYFMGIEGVTYNVAPDGKFEYTDEICKNKNGLTYDEAAGQVFMFVYPPDCFRYFCTLGES